MDVNREIISMLPYKPQVCVIGDSVGGTVITSLAQLVPGHVFVVARQDVMTCAILWENIASFFRAMAVYFGGAVNVFRFWRIGTEPSSLDEYDSVDAKRALLQDCVVSLHNRYPWEFIQGLRCPRSREAVLSHFHLLIYQPIWNRGYQVKMLDIQREMGLDTRENNFQRPLDVDLVNDLALADHEASHEETFRNMDKFIMEPMQAVGATVDVIVVTLRGSVSADTWESLRAGGCLLAMTYAITKQMEQFPNERDSRLVFNPDTGELDRLPDLSDRPSHARIREKKDANGGRLGQIFAVILQRRGTGGEDVECKSLPYKREWWYGEYMHVRDADKQAMYVLKTSHEVPCRRISAKGTTLTVLMERQLKGRRHSASQYTMIPARERKIEVQIEDLTFMLHELTVYEAALNSGETIVLDEHYRIMQDIAQAEYSYKYIDSVVSQSNRHDSASQKAYGQHLIDAKITLFREVHTVMHRIRHRNGWRLPAVVKRPSAYEEVPREDLVDFKQNQREFIRRPGAASRLPLGSLLPQLIDLATPMTLGDHNQCEDSIYYDGGDSSVGEKDDNRDGDPYGGGIGPRDDGIDDKGAAAQEALEKRLYGHNHGKINDRAFRHQGQGRDKALDHHDQGKTKMDKSGDNRGGLQPTGSGPAAPPPKQENRKPTADLTPQERANGWQGGKGKRVDSKGSGAYAIKHGRELAYAEMDREQKAFHDRYVRRQVLKKLFESDSEWYDWAKSQYDKEEIDRDAYNLLRDNYYWDNDVVPDAETEKEVYFVQTNDLAPEERIFIFIMKEHEKRIAVYGIEDVLAEDEIAERQRQEDAEIAERQRQEDAEIAERQRQEDAEIAERQRQAYAESERKRLRYEEYVSNLRDDDDAVEERRKKYEEAVQAEARARAENWDDELDDERTSEEEAARLVRLTQAEAERLVRRTEAPEAANSYEQEAPMIVRRTRAPGARR
jgi:hypothetical protein